MTKRPLVGWRERKPGLGPSLSRVRRGETILVTDRNEPVAELRPVPGASDPSRAGLRTAAALGVVTLPVRPRPGRFTLIRSHGKLASAAVSTDRDDRG